MLTLTTVCYCKSFVFSPNNCLLLALEVGTPCLRGHWLIEEKTKQNKTYYCYMKMFDFSYFSDF